MNKKRIIAKVILKLADIPQNQIDLLEELKKITNPQELNAVFNSSIAALKLDRQEIIKFLGKAKEMGVFKKHFVLPQMERTWRMWTKEQGLANQIRFES